MAHSHYTVPGLLRDYRVLSTYSRTVGTPDLMREVDGVTRIALPDVWIQNALRRDAVDDAVACWFENVEHERIRHAADALIKACPSRTDILVSGRLRQADYQIGRATRSRYRRACKILNALRNELNKANASQLWMLAIDDVLRRYGHRPALVDELEKASVI